MTHSYDDPAGAMSRGKTERMLVRAFGVTLAVAGAVSLVHLVGQYRQAGPYRAAQAVERAAEAAQRARERETPVPTRTFEPPPSATSPSTAGASAPGAGGGDGPISGAARWKVRPDWPSIGGDLFPEGVSRISVRFRCQSNAQGVLSSCSATENPARTGLGARMRPALDAARLEPVLIGGRPLLREVEFGVSFTAEANPAPAPSEPPASALPPEAPPAPEPAPVN